MTRKADQTSITGRDGFIVNKALLYAIAHIQSLPEERQEWSDMRDMCAILKAYDSPFTLPTLMNVEHHTGLVPNLWPEADEDLSDCDKAERDEFRANYRKFTDFMRTALEDFAKRNPLSSEAA